ncbi:uncharacterized protein LOC134726611 [Mytilus trossulus]|uniref:uncharacterized protein LOC134726611 n=1 Tax=Mytilus trossulus TaxID=6551 RepID=UPI00300645A1
MDFGRLIFSIEIRNGGYLTYINRETNTTNNVSLMGITTTRNYTVQWDLNPPNYPCFQLLGTNCTTTPIDILDVTHENSIPFTWKQWSDNPAGIERYKYEVFHLQPYGNVLRESDLLFSSYRTPDSELESCFNVTTPGMYSILLTAFDKAGNYKSTRSVFFFDNQSFVETTPGTRTTVLESTLDSNYTWVVFDTSLLNVTWAGRFMNERHDVHKWLNEIDTNKHIDHDHDDRFGRRTVQWCPNVKGIVRFDINYTVTGANIESPMGYIEVQETLREASLLNISWEDGDKLDISVKATDIIGKYTEDKITIYKDTSYPAIENLWLSYGNKSELFVHRQQDLTSMT